MTQSEFSLLENYMLSCMRDSAHDQEHIYRVLYVALDIASYETKVNTDILIAACLLHDIGRSEQFENPKLCHAKVGSEKAYRFLIENGWQEEFARHIGDCILTHRFRSDYPPATLEAKILFDSDKLDVTGALGIARTLLYKGKVAEPLYTVLDDKTVSDGSGDLSPSFFQEYQYKLKRLYDKFYTVRAKEIAEARRVSAENFYHALFHEVTASYQKGKETVSKLLIQRKEWS